MRAAAGTIRAVAQVGSRPRRHRNPAAARWCAATGKPHEYAARPGLDVAVARPPIALVRLEGALQREFRFNDFADAVDFVNRVAEVAERANHHPEIIIRWNRVTLRWRTHTADAVTARDIELAGRTNELV